jgi:hypothetical protein
VFVGEQAGAGVDGEPRAQRLLLAVHHQAAAVHLHQQPAVVELAHDDVDVGGAQVQAQRLGAQPHSLHAVLDAVHHKLLVQGGEGDAGGRQLPLLQVAEVLG